MSAAFTRGPNDMLIDSIFYLAKCHFLTNSLLHSCVDIELFRRSPTRITESLSIKGDNLNNDLDDTHAVCDSSHSSTAK